MNNEHETPRYPLGEHAREEIVARSGRPLDELTLENVRAGWLGPDDFAIHPDTLRMQAAVAEEAGYPQLAANLRRAAELALVPNDRVLAIYEALRPYRVGYERLLALADELERDYDAVENARLIREAAEAYLRQGLV
ncbi:MAG TPA: glycerol dehydrogenase [Chloroflexi bacterium]|jgi:propanediol dehydratase small subunit|nr:glycerol dehydrogenase [Chloroflexota bacterium]